MMNIFRRLITAFFLFTINLCDAQIDATYSGDEFVLGHYYTKEGEKIKGLIEHVVKMNNLVNDPPFNSIKYKPFSGAPTQKLTTRDISGFVLVESKEKIDSFSIIKNFVLPRIVTGKNTVEIREDFAQIMQSGEITLYTYHYASTSLALDMLGSPSKVLYTTYCLKRKEGNTVTVLNRKNFKKDMMNYFKNYPSLVRVIDREQVKFEDMEYIVSQYNSWHDKNNNVP